MSLKCYVMYKHIWIYFILNFKIFQTNCSFYHFNKKIQTKLHKQSLLKLSDYSRKPQNVYSINRLIINATGFCKPTFNILKIFLLSSKCDRTKDHSNIFFNMKSINFGWLRGCYLQLELVLNFLGYR